ncbi:helix-turn-helix domain-containing protein [Kineosporia babensis]|uniref:Helix-turn-helix domain-containing protein n=1 Tax=Kineosporia babensis TaxID=499548 RepID=A0A9X1NB51_9ACTN|nr:helix-turn-helix domain-containing protein [Kineosporia babensis]
MGSSFRAAFGRGIKVERTAAGLTQAELGALLKVSDRTISSWETGDRTFPWDVLPELCDALDCAPADLFARASEEDRRKLKMP